MAKRIQIKGAIVPNDYAFYYEWFEMDYTTPDKVRKAIDEANGEQLIVEINSPGGEIASGSEIYSMLKSYRNVKIEVTGEACSAASIIAMAGYSEMASTALMMVHCVSTCASGNHNQMEKAAEILTTADKALCTAYVSKSGMSEEEALEMMEHETWLTAAQAIEKGLIDAVLNEDNEPLAMVAGMFQLPTDEQLNAVREQLNAVNNENADKLHAVKARLHFLSLKK